MKLNTKKTRLPFTPEELEKHYQQVKKSAHVFRNKKKYHRPSSKKGG